MRDRITYTALRIVAGVLFTCHGLQKMFGMLGGQKMAFGSMLGWAGLIETVAGLLIVIGLFTSAAAILACGEMAVAYFIQHAPKGGLPIQNGGELAVLYCVIFLYIAVHGASVWSVGRLIGPPSFGRRVRNLV